MMCAAESVTFEQAARAKGVPLSASL